MKKLAMLYLSVLIAVLTVHLHPILASHPVYMFPQTGRQVQVRGSKASGTSSGGYQGDGEAAAEACGAEPERGVHEGRQTLSAGCGGEGR